MAPPPRLARGAYERHSLIGRPVEHELRELVISGGKTGYVALYANLGDAVDELDAGGPAGASGGGDLTEQERGSLEALERLVGRAVVVEPVVELGRDQIEVALSG